MNTSVIPRLSSAFGAAFSRVWYSFPVQLLALHFRQNHLLLTLWVLLSLFISDTIAAKFGVKYLFLEPEYLGSVGFASFFFLGLGLGGLVMTWNLTTYLLNARYFPFLATLERPFGKYCMNNALLPLAFFAFYAIRLRVFLKSELDFGEGQHIAIIGAILLGLVLVVLCYILYFRFTNKDIASYPHLRDVIRGRQRRRRIMPPGYRKMDVARIISGETAWRVDTYLTERFQTRRTRSIAHYRPAYILRIFKQNHLNALVLQTALLVGLMATGLGIDLSWIRIPAGASIFILFSVIVAFAGAITYWFHAWRTTIFLALLVVINIITGQDWFSFRNRAYGMDYDAKLPKYSYAKLEELASPNQVAADQDSMLQILERWRANTEEERPKMVLLCVSGGGLKATYWTTHVLQSAQAATEGQLLAHTSLISGASGGMIGAAYFRELAYRAADNAETDPFRSRDPLMLPREDVASLQLTSRVAGDFSADLAKGENAKNDDLQLAIELEELAITDQRLLEPVGRDLLNSVAFAIVSKDLFLPGGNFELHGAKYRKDRAYAFEQQLMENTGNLLSRSLAEYEEAEREAKIPMLLLTPSIVNDARRLVISPLGVRHLTLPPAGVGRSSVFEVDAVDFGAFFSGNRPDRLYFPTALRMNATYPYVLPNVYLPSEPPVEVMDAGFRDNFGVLQASRFLQVYGDWIKENTSGVALVQISTLEKFEREQEYDPEGWIESLFNPLGVAGQLISLQDFQTDETVGLLYDLLGPEYFDFIRFSYRPAEDRKAASMTFHLTNGEKADIRSSINHPDNVLAMERLREQLKNKISPHEIEKVLEVAQ